MRNAGFLSILLLAVSLAGCSDSAPPTQEVDPDGPPEVEVTSTTGGIRGVVVDQAILTVADATVLVKETGDETITDANGVFLFSGLAAGTYTLEATKPLYDTVQATAIVEAGVKNPDAVKIQLTRLTNQNPYAPTFTYNGYLFCSINIVVPELTYLLSEECGEGVGVPGVGRVGGNPDNNAQIDFGIDSGLAVTMMAEVVWEPSLSVGPSGSQSGAFNMGIYTDFVCDPGCGWSNQIDRKNGGSPLILRSDDGESPGLGMSGDIASFPEAGFNEDTAFSTFTWASSEETGILIEQPFKMYQTTSYLLPLPEGWAFTNDDSDPWG